MIHGDSKDGEKAIDEQKDALKDLPRRRMMTRTSMTNPMLLRVIKRSVCKRKGELYSTTTMMMTKILSTNIILTTCNLI